MGRDPGIRDPGIGVPKCNKNNVCSNWDGPKISWRKWVYTRDVESADRSLGFAVVAALHLSSRSIRVWDLWRPPVLHSALTVCRPSCWAVVKCRRCCICGRCSRLLCLHARACLSARPAHLAGCVTWPDELVFTCHLQVPVMLFPRSCCNSTQLGSARDGWLGSHVLWLLSSVTVLPSLCAVLTSHYPNGRCLLGQTAFLTEWCLSRNLTSNTECSVYSTWWIRTALCSN